MNTQVEPFSDIRVRKAMQMALNLDEINQGFFRGSADAIPQGALSRTSTAATPFDEWPADVKKAFENDPAGAEALLDEAGYPRGADGVRFTTEFMHLARYDLNYTELLISYWDAIGVKVEADVQPLAEFVARRQDRNFELINAEGAGEGNPLIHVKRFIPSTSWNTANADDEWYNAKFAEALAATTLEEHYTALGELDMYSIEQFWSVLGPGGSRFALAQPWVVGFNGEAGLGSGALSVVFSRLWFDSSLKP